MRTILLASASLVLSVPVMAQGTAAPAPAAPSATCYIEIRRLMAEPPAGIGELGDAIRQLDAALRPQVEEIKVLKAQIARLQRQSADPSIAALEPVSLGYDDTALAQPAPDDPAGDEIMRLQAELGEKQHRLKLDYAARQDALVDPVQARISRGAQAFVASSGCAEVKMARQPDLAALAQVGARDVTSAFVTWYTTNPPG